MNGASRETRRCRTVRLKVGLHQESTLSTGVAPHPTASQKAQLTIWSDFPKVPALARKALQKAHMITRQHSLENPTQKGQFHRKPTCSAAFDFARAPLKATAPVGDVQAPARMFRV